MSKILLLNAGSSSVKWKVFTLADEKVIAEGEVERINTPKAMITIKYNGEKLQSNEPDLGYESAVRLILKKIQELKIASLNEISTVGHRVVAGGRKFTKATKITPEVLAEIKALKDFAPLHNPNEARYIELMQKILPNVAQYVVFDSVFFTDMPEMNAIYSLPYELTEKYGLRRYGEHGISHGYLSQRAAEILDRPLDELKLITLHLGSGASVAAIKEGKAFDSSMGFTPLPGVTMGTRSGDVDPAIIPFLMEKERKTVEDVMNLLNDKSGILGISGFSSDMRDIEAKWVQNDERASLAREIFINRVVKYVGGYFTELNGIDAIVVAGGIGEHQIDLRYDLLHKLECLGIEVDEQKNQINKEGIISPNGSKIKTLMIPTNEELAMVRQIKSVL
ncbi:acetate/propionate family kinase [Ligilactobacillus sp. LYQ135]